MQPQDNIERVLGKLKSLPPGRINEIEDFIDFLSDRSQNRKLTQRAQKVTEPLLEHIWDNDEDAAYDEL